MRPPSILIPVAVLMCLSSTPAFAQQRPITIDDIMQLKTVAAPAVSPDGASVLYTIRQWEPASEREKDRLTRIHAWVTRYTLGEAAAITTQR